MGMGEIVEVEVEVGVAVAGGIGVIVGVGSGTTTLVGVGVSVGVGVGIAVPAVPQDEIKSTPRTPNATPTDRILPMPTSASTHPMRQLDAG
ncbi:MAG: hypothetical protein O2826_02400 [Chloroflexi bacterium]|nr:hypothetical protein [Chloroflexota bacterium]